MITDLIYADDQAMVAHPSEELENKLSNWNTIMVENGMRISKEKSEVMLLSRAHQDVNIYLEKQSLKQCRNFKYLGVEFNYQNYSKLEITSRIHKFTNNLYLLYPLMKDRNILLKVKTIIYISTLRPILIYGHESWTLTSETRIQIQAAAFKTHKVSNMTE